MIRVSTPVALIAGGTDEEWALHGRAIAGYLKLAVKRVEPEQAECRFGDVLAQMNAAHTPLAESMCRGMDSMAGLL